jgi:hypothetical protein
MIPNQHSLLSTLAQKLCDSFEARPLTIIMDDISVQKVVSDLAGAVTTKSSIQQS